ncbi:cyclin-domain-containing protein [Phyllosticta citrichinensis]
MPATFEDYTSAARPPNNSVALSLQIPSTITTPQTSMSQLAAEITCLFWFENSSVLHQALDTRTPPLPIAPLVEDAQPTPGFRKWVATILSTTQVTQNVVLLALLFIYRLKTINPAVKGKPGSEYRLLTVALMLGNKFLDDNTYTNKTWADVSGISVQEVHIMEVEFLSNMKYNLFTSAEAWNKWHVTLGKFGTYVDKASRARHELPLRTLGPPTPTLHVPPALPSPPHSTHASPPFANGFSPNHSYSNTPTLLPQISSTAVSPIGPLPELNLRPGTRKRSHDEHVLEPASKRPLRDFASSTGPRETLPNFTTMSQPPPMTQTSNPATTAPPPMLPPLPNLSVPQLPPPSGRAMSLVYPPPMQWGQQQSSISTSGGPILPIPQPQQHAIAASRQLSPYPNDLASNSPIHPSFSSAAPPKQNRLSPSFYLSQRSSPYRPVRQVNTLLVPPPSGSMSQPPRLGTDQMQYQPLGRPSNERRAGPLPYMHFEAWPATNQFNQWPVLPQPNFSR